MLRSLLGFFGGSAQPAAVRAKSFDERLREIGYLGELPSCFICPINHEVMSNPVMINNDMRFTFEAAALARWRTNQNTCPFTRNEISTVTKNDDLLTKIEAFVKSLENIHRLELDIVKSQNIDINQLNTIINEANIDPLEAAEFIEDQTEAMKRQQAELKLSLALEIQFLIAHTVTIIQSQEKEEQEKQDEINSIITPYRLRFIQLRSNLRFWFPDFYNKTNGPDVTDATPNIFFYFKRRDGGDPRIRGLVHGLYGAALYHPFAFMRHTLPLLQIEGPQADPATAAQVELDEEANTSNQSSSEQYRPPTPGKRHD